MPDRQDNALITVSVDGRSLGIFEDRSGGVSDSASSTYPLGGMGKRRALGGKPEVTNVTVTRIFDEAARGYIKWLRGRAGKGVMIVKEQPLDDEGLAIGDLETWTGLLKSVAVADRKADAGAAETFALEMVVEGPVA